jgi:RNA polymerase sigma-54 factor
MELKQQLKLTQQLVMTPQLQQAIKLLQLSRLELSDLITQEINENPVLDEALEPELEAKEERSERVDEAAMLEDRKPEPAEDFDWRDYVDRSFSPSGGGYFDGGERDEYSPSITKKTSFADHLLWQLHLYDFSDQEMVIGEYIIGNINKDGYLLLTPDEVAADLGVERQCVEEVRRRIMRFDPVGVASLNLAECLLAQTELLPCDSGLIKLILLHCMKELERKKYQVIARDLKMPLKDVLEACEIIANMEPRPGRAFNDNETQYVTPDIYVYKAGDDYVVMLNEDGQPKLRINSFYKNILAGNKDGSDKTKEYIQDKLRSAVWLIKSVYHRQSTIVNVMKSIIKFQRDFFDYGTGYLKPLVLRDIAEDVGMHESNVSRITTNKYVLTPHGIFELKYFFNSGLSSDDGDSIASESVKNMIKELVMNEDSRKPCSDQEIVKMLKAKGVNIARRTVTKYREMLGVLSSSKRKKHIYQP